MAPRPAAALTILVVRACYTPTGAIATVSAPALDM